MLRQVFLLIVLVCSACSSLCAQQTVFYNWLRYHQQKILPTYLSRDYSSQLGYIETNSSYILPYYTTDFKYGEGGMFILHKDGQLDSVLLWDSYNPLIRSNHIVSTVKIHDNLFALNRNTRDSFDKSHVEIIFVDSFFHEISKTKLSQSAILSFGVYKGFNDSYAIVTVKYLVSLSPNETMGELLRIGLDNSITHLYNIRGKGSNYIFGFALDTMDNTYVIFTQNDLYTTNSSNNRDTLIFAKIRQDGTKVWEYQWQEYSNKSLGYNHRPHFIIDSSGYKFFTSFVGDTTVIHFLHIARDGQSHRTIQKYNFTNGGLWNQNEFILPNRKDKSSYFSFGYGIDNPTKAVFDTQQNKWVNNYNLHVSKIDSAGNTIWIRNHNTNNPNIKNMRDWRLLSCVERVSDGGFLLYGYSLGIFKNLPPSQLGSYCLVIKTDSCGYGPRDTCRLLPRIDSIVYNTVYLSLDEALGNVCGRRWHIKGSVITSDKLIYTFSDTGTYTVGIWGFAGATTDSTSITFDIERMKPSAIIASIAADIAEYTLSPNPTQGELEINIPMTSTKEVEVLLYDILGQTQLQAAIPQGKQKIQLYLDRFPSGIYFVKVANVVKKVVLHR